ncbi:CDP-glucose 4,6-dehydratase [Rhodobacterales bacterium LSUCC0387]|nr:CDP-glucose 4,6-dehydratase [Rhodobacterales bacterium LSUCC0387]
MKPNFWQGRRVFITGHTGFKGSWMSLWLQKLGAELTGYALPPPAGPSLFNEASVAEHMTSCQGDVRDANALTVSIQAASPEIVFHMAAQSLVRVSYQNPLETYATNVMGTVNLLEAVRATPSVKAVVIVTTDKCYENREWVWGYRENDPMGGYDPYSSSKACAELVSSAYRSSFFNVQDYDSHGVGIASARAGNVIGGGDWAEDRLIPDILAAFEKNKTALIRNPGAVRPWQHVLEPVRGYMLLAERMFCEGPFYADSWNFGPNAEDIRPVSWIAENMAKLWGGCAQWDIDPSEHPHEAVSLKLDISKARDSLQWQPRLELRDALKLVVEWSRKRQSGVDVRALTEQQISNYQELDQQ